MKRLFYRAGRKKCHGEADGRRDPPCNNDDGTGASLTTHSLLLPERLTPQNDRSSPQTPSPPGRDPRRKELKTISISTDVAKKDYWQLAMDKLQEDDPSTADQIAIIQQTAAETGSIDFAAQLLHTTEQSRRALEAKRWKITTSAGEVVLRDHLDRLLKVVTVFKDVGNAAASLDPVHAGLPLAGFCILMQITTNDSEQYAAMVAGVEEIVTIIARYQQIEALYLQRPQTTLKYDFERHLISLYKHIIRYQVLATCYYRRNTMLRVLRSIPKLDDVSNVVASIRADDAACEKIGQVFDSSDALERHQEILEKFDWFRKYLMNQANLGSLSETRHVHWTVTRSPNTLFTGRDDLLQNLDTTIRDAVKDSLRPDQCRIVISGMGGQGKSEICLQLTYRVRQIFWGVFWVDVSTISSAENGFLAIASTLGISAQTWEEARQGLANVKQSWLLVLDNADDPEVDYQRYFSAGRSSVVILTSRNTECHRYSSTQPIELGGLPESEARELLLRAADVPLDRSLTLQDDAQVVASLLRSHPLALIQAGAYVSRGHCTLAEYPGVYERQRKRLLEFRSAQAQSRYRDVYATFEASTVALQASQTEAAGDALQLLPMMATCAASRLPLPLFEAAWKVGRSINSSTTNDNDNDLLRLTPWHVYRFPSFIQANADRWDPFRLIEAVSLLKSFSLISTDTHDGYLSMSMHPLIHVWARDRQDAILQHQSWVMTGCLVAISSGEHVLWRKCRRQLQPHLQALTSWEIGKMFGTEPPVMIIRILIKCGWLLYGMKDDATVFMLTQSLFTHLNLDHLKVDQRWLAVYDLTAWNLVNCGKVTEAVSLLIQVVRIREKKLSEDHPHRLASQHVLAMAYRANGQVKEAVRLLVQVVKIREHTLAEDHPDRLASQHVLAMAYRANGQVKEAVSLLEQVVNIKEQTLLKDHPDRLASQHVLAGAYEANGQVKEAVLLQEGVVKIQEQTLAKDHPDRLASLHVLGMVYQANGQVEKAVSLQEEVVKIQEQTLAADHPHRLASQYELARAYRENGQTKEAAKLLEHVVRLREHTLAKSHPDRLASQHNLATLYWELGDRNAAVRRMKRVVAVRKQVLDDDHRDRIESEAWLEYFRREIGDLETA